MRRSDVKGELKVEDGLKHEEQDEKINIDR